MMRKFLSICIITILLAGAGATIYAKTNAAQNLSNWYKNAFQQKSEIMGSITATQIIKGVAGFNQFVSESKNNFDAVIAALRDDSVKDTQSVIEMRHDELVKELNETVVDLQQETFDDYVDELNIEAEITREVEEMLEELVNE